MVESTMVWLWIACILGLFSSVGNAIMDNGTTSKTQSNGTELKMISTSSEVARQWSPGCLSNIEKRSFNKVGLKINESKIKYKYMIAAGRPTDRFVILDRAWNLATKHSKSIKDNDVILKIQRRIQTAN
jgi:hypothetical protein